MNQLKSGPATRPSPLLQFGLMALALVVILGALFRDGLRPGWTVFSNDGPLGAISARCAELPSFFFGYWLDLNWLGSTGPSASLSLSAALGFVGGPLVYSKIYAPFALFVLGLSAWVCFRQWKLGTLACVLGGLAAALNSDFFSTACWGVAAQPLNFGLNYLALAALADVASPRRWLRVLLAGFAVGMAVTEGYDVGAIFSLVIAMFVLYQALTGEGTMPQRLGRGVARVALVGACAAFISASTVLGLISTQIKGVANMGQDAASKAQRWSEATQWSLPKREALGLIVPGLFGYRMDTPLALRPEWLQDYYKGGNYWGACGRDLAWDRYFASDKQGPRPGGYLRFGGGGIYSGVLVAAIALWAALQALRKENSVFSGAERRFIWFWSVLALGSALVGFGRYAPFYQFFYALPFASTIRNPAKFFHVVQWALLILFACGVQGLSRRYLEAPAAATRGLWSQLRAWWAKAGAFDKNWVRGSAIALGVSLAAWLIYAASHERLVAYLQEVDFDAGTAGAIASFSIRQAGWFVPTLALALGLVALVLSGYFNGRRARLGGVLLGVFLVADLGWANLPWVITWNWVQKYATNPVIELLREKPYEHRVAVLPFRPPPQLAVFSDLYQIEWKQQLFPYYNIQSLDIVQMPRQPVDFLAFEQALVSDGSGKTQYLLARRWQFTNTRYLLGPVKLMVPPATLLDTLEVLNQQFDPAQRRFRILLRFDLGLKPGVTAFTAMSDVTAEIKPDGSYAVFEFTGALPRAKLYTNWQVSTNDQATLKDLTSAEFDPAQTVLVANPSLPSPPPPSPLNSQAATNSVEFSSYAPKDIVLRAKAGSPTVLLLNDRFHPDWKVTVDGKPEPLLRCNFLMRGVYLPAGTHTVEFRFEPPVDMLYVSLAGVVIGLALLGYVAFAGQKKAAPGSTGTPSVPSIPAPTKQAQVAR